MSKDKNKGNSSDKERVIRNDEDLRKSLVHENPKPKNPPPPPRNPSDNSGDKKGK